MPHRGGPRREDRHVSPALAEQLELILLDRLADLVIGDGRVSRRLDALAERRELAFPPLSVRRGSGRVVPVTVDDQNGIPSKTWRAGSAAREWRMWSLTAIRFPLIILTRSRTGQGRGRTTSIAAHCTPVTTNWPCAPIGGFAEACALRRRGTSGAEVRADRFTSAEPSGAEGLGEQPLGAGDVRRSRGPFAGGCARPLRPPAFPPVANYFGHMFVSVRFAPNPDNGTISSILPRTLASATLASATLGFRGTHTSLLNSAISDKASVPCAVDDRGQGS